MSEKFNPVTITVQELLGALESADENAEVYFIIHDEGLETTAEFIYSVAWYPDIMMRIDIHLGRNCT